jgi:hypothetical protein
MSDITDFGFSESLKGMVRQAEQANKAWQDALLKAVMPGPLTLTKMAESFVVPLPNFNYLIEQAVFQPMNWELLAKETNVFPDIASRFRREMHEISERAAEVMRECEDGAERLAKSGWTLPVQMSPRQMVELLKRKTEDELDQDFIAFYHEDGELHRLKPTLLQSARLKTWNSLLEQCFENYEAGKYLICIPALLSVLEGAIASSEGAQFVRAQQRIDFFRNKVEVSSAGSLKELMWKTLDVFIARLYEPSDFRGSRPLRLNRHWILHGRDLPSDWTTADALRLFHALATVSTLCD